LDGEAYSEHPPGASDHISLETLDTELGATPAASILKIVHGKGGAVRAPKHEDLNVGDVILSRPTTKQKPNISAHQESHNRPKEASRWTHAMLYVGNLHVLESNPPSFKDRRNGVRISPLVITEGQSTDFVVLRHKSELFERRRFSMVRRALLDYHLSKPKYDWKAAANAFFFQLSGKRSSPQLHLAANCSEYVLSCYANGAETLVEDYVKIHQDDENHFFFPADLYCNASFDKLPMDFYTFED